mmetsp:Transcript_44723/g.70008  ORF Transcript_44723/g.70008 Transcript_44723/m.70008 type:complete len:210 (+) Transcript_44723:637-1266(+)
MDETGPCGAENPGLSPFHEPERRWKTPCAGGVGIATIRGEPLGRTCGEPPIRCACCCCCAACISCACTSERSCGSGGCGGCSGCCDCGGEATVCGCTLGGEAEGTAPEGTWWWGCGGAKGGGAGPAAALNGSTGLVVVVVTVSISDPTSWRTSTVVVEAGTQCVTGIHSMVVVRVTITCCSSSSGVGDTSYLHLGQVVRIDSQRETHSE